MRSGKNFGNLVPPDFDYKAFCSLNYFREDNDLNSSSYINDNHVILIIALILEDKLIII